MIQGVGTSLRKRFISTRMINHEVIPNAEVNDKGEL